jgi:hypothetical protein
MKSAFALAAVALLALTAFPPPAAAGTPLFPLNFVNIQALQYNGPLGPVAVVDSGGAVTWENHEFLDIVGLSDVHTVTADDFSWSSGDLDVHQTYSHVVNAPTGTVIQYHCDYHPFMIGLIVVR